MQAARRSLSQGDGPAAWSACLQIVHDWPEEAGAWHLLGVLALCDGDRAAAEVRRPIYRSSVGRSAALLRHLQPLVEALGPLAAGSS